MANAADKKANELSDQLETLRADIAGLKSTMAEYGRAQGTHLRAVASEKVNEAAAKGAAKADELRDAANKTYADTEDAVRQNPAAAVGIAAGLGFVVGLLMSRRI